MELKEALIDLFDVSSPDAAFIASKFKAESLSKQDYLLREGQYSRKLSFIASGLLRFYVQTERAEVTQWIGGPSYFATDIAAFLFGTAARWNIQALTDVKLWSLSETEYRELEQHFPDWNLLEKRLTGKCFVMLENRVLDFLSLSAEGRYKRLFAANP